MLNFISNLSAFALKRFRLLYGRDKDSLFRVLMFVQCHAQTLLLSSTIFITSHALNVMYAEFAVNFSKQSCESAIIHKINIYHSGVFRHYVHHNARNFNSFSRHKSYLVHDDHFMFNWQLKCTSGVSNYTTKVFFAWLYLIKTSFANVCIHRIHVRDHARHILRALSRTLGTYFTDSLMPRCDWYCLES